MRLNPEHLSHRDKVILSGLFLSKYDDEGLKRLGFDTFAEAFNSVGYALGSRPMTIKNYRDEFDPLFRNPRKGWHKRPIRDYCRAVLNEYRDLPLHDFAGLITSFVGDDENIWTQFRVEATGSERESTFAKRLITGLAAERYFQSVQPTVAEFTGYELEDTTKIGCGYDFRLNKPGNEFLAVEVKGLKERTGTISLTPREYDAAVSYSDRFFLFVVKNFQESPFHELYRNPVLGRLHFVRREAVVIHTSWHSTV